MKCFHCGNEIADDIDCSFCGKNQKTYRDILIASDAAYNEGLYRARLRDISGAIESLHRAIAYNKYNIEARNLLGLCYYETGQSVYALREWVLSKNLVPADNPVDEYLSKIQRPGVINKIDNVIQKYNQSLSHCKQGNRDLARIQLKRILSGNSHLVEGMQMLALILMQDGKYDDAQKYLVRAAAIDAKNPRTMAYLAEVKRVIKERPQKRKKKPNKNIVDFADGNDTIIMPRRPFSDFFEGMGNGVINIILGIILGILVGIFLIMPTIKTNQNNDAQNAVVSANKEIANSANNLASLQKEVDSLNKELEKYTGQGDLKTSYEKLLEANLALEDKDIETAASAMETVNRSLLDKKGKALYDSINATVSEENIKSAYAEGKKAFRSRKYDKAEPLLKLVVDADEKYDTGDALYSLAVCYDELGENEKAVEYYNKFIEAYPGTRRARRSKSRVEALSESSEEANDTAAETQQ